MTENKTVEAWMDEELNEVSEEDAVVHMVAEYDDEDNLVFEYMEVVGDESEDKAAKSDLHTLRVSSYSPPQVQGDPVFKELFLEQPGVEEKTEVTLLPDGSAFFVAEVPTKEERDAEKPPEEEEKKKEEKPPADDEERELRRRYLIERLELVKDVRKRIRGDEG